MTLFWVPGQGYVDDSQEGAQIPHYGELALPDGSKITWGTEGIREVPWYDLPYQYSSEQGTRFQWEPGMAGTGETPAGMDVAPGYINSLLQTAAAAEAGTLKDYEREAWEQQKAAALSVPLRDIRSLYGGWTAAPDDPTSQRLLNVFSPDIGNFMLSVRDKMAQGTATPQERQLFDETARMAMDWDYRATVPQASDAFNPLGDQLFGALAILGTGATAGLAAAPLLAGGAGLATTLGSLGTLAGTAGGWASTIGGATGQDWLAKAGLGLGALGGVLGGVGGLANLWGTGVQSLSDAARLASSAGKITGALGSASGNDALRQASRYLGQAGQLGQFGSGVVPSSVTDWSGDHAPWAANVAPGVSNLLSAADVATQRGGGMEWDYSNDWGASAPYDDWSWDAGATAPDYFQSPAYQQFTGWGGDETQMPWYQGADLDTSGGGGGGGSSVLGALGSVGKFLGSNASWLGPAASALGGLGAGAIGSNASSDAARLQADALQRALTLQEAQWLNQQAQQAPWLAAGQHALPQLQQLAAQGARAPFQPGATISGANYALPSTTPGWQPQTFQGPQALNAGDYRYAPPGTVNPAQYAWNAPQALDPAQYAFNAPTGQALLAQDPGYQFRQDEARRALEASAAAKGGLTSGATLSALGRQAQEIASNEYANAYGRFLGENQLRYGRGLTAEQENYQRQLQANQLGYGRASEQQQLAAQQGLQAAGFNWQSALQGQQTGYNQALQSAQWNQGQQQQYAQELYNRMLQQSQLRYGQDVSQNQADYERALQAYNSQTAGDTIQWNRLAALAGYGPQAISQLATGGQAAQTQLNSLLSQLGTAQAGGATNQANAWMNALTNVGGAVQGYAGQQAYMQGLQSLLAGLNR